MTAWLKQNPDPAVQDSRGDERKSYLINFMVHQMRAKAGQKNMTVTTGSSSSKSELTDVFWWGMDKMDTELGKSKGEAWRSSGKLKKRPCPITGSSDDPFVEMFFS